MKLRASLLACSVYTMTNTTPPLSPAATKAVESFASLSWRKLQHLTITEARRELLDALDLADYDKAVFTLVERGFLPQGATRMGPVLGRVYAEVQGVDWPSIRRIDLAR
ncbi:hypothetical protein SEA_CEN1621_58 [Microbacterium phage Cen1621]|uniref:Uncharacterized protein n=1 Tax=Microbacterium phage Cen1621 TaxID=2965191 RepID=A0A9E7Q9W1_9CAUD|nr:hypothetical protein SEA_CEN1621_58 [Microbacterium phage Cen1621]